MQCVFSWVSKDYFAILYTQFSPKAESGHGVGNSIRRTWSLSSRTRIREQYKVWQIDQNLQFRHQVCLLPPFPYVDVEVAAVTCDPIHRQQLCRSQAWLQTLAFLWKRRYAFWHTWSYVRASSTKGSGMLESHSCIIYDSIWPILTPPLHFT